MSVILIRGVSGSGKSTLVESLTESIKAQGGEVVVCSADHFFEVDVPTIGGGSFKDYVFNPFKLAEAHSACYGKFLDALTKDAELTVIVDNTFIHHWEMMNYIKAAAFVGEKVLVYEFRVKTINDLKLCIKRNKHRVPAEVIAKMALEFEPWEDAPTMDIFQ